jgi:hypothetical protein
MNAENLIIDNSSDREAIETLNELLPELQTVSSFALVIKSIYSVNGAALMISSQQEEILWIFDFVCHHQTNYLKVLLASVYIISEE